MEYPKLIFAYSINFLKVDSKVALRTLKNWSDLEEVLWKFWILDVVMEYFLYIFSLICSKVNS